MYHWQKELIKKMTQHKGKGMPIITGRRAGFSSKAFQRLWDDLYSRPVEDIKLSEGTVYGSRYLTVHPSNSWQWNEMMDWMIKTFGPSACDGVWTPNMRWYANNAKFWFRNEKDLTMFILRWS